MRVDHKAQVVQCEDQKLGAIDGEAGNNLYQYARTVTVPFPKYTSTDCGHSESNAPEFDPKVVRRLRLKIDLWTVPMIFLISGLSFLDRANIGKSWTCDLVLAMMADLFGR